MAYIVDKKYAKKNGVCRVIAEKSTILSEQVKKCNSLPNEKKFKNNDEKINHLKKKGGWKERKPPFIICHILDTKIAHFPTGI